MTAEEFKKIYEKFQLLSNTYKLNISERAKKLKPAHVSKFLGKPESYVGSCFHRANHMSVKKLIEIAEAVEQMENGGIKWMN